MYIPTLYLPLLHPCPQTNPEYGLSKHVDYSTACMPGNGIHITLCNECTKVQNSLRHACHESGQTLLGGMINGNSQNSAYNQLSATVNTIMRMRAFCRKIDDYMYGFQWRSAGSLQRSGFRENPTNFCPLLPTEYVTVISGQIDAFLPPAVRYDLTD